MTVRDHSAKDSRGQHLFPVLGSDEELTGVLTRNQLIQLYQQLPSRASTVKLSEIATQKPQVAYADEPLRIVANRMADSGFTRLPVLDPAGNGRIVGMVGLNDLLHARTKNLDNERARERVLRIRMPFGPRARERKIALTEEADFREGAGPASEVHSDERQKMGGSRFGAGKMTRERRRLYLVAISF